MTPLPDINVLVALARPNDVHHGPARAWFTAVHAAGWATCPITESGFLRVSSNRRVIPDARSPREAIMVLTRLRGLPGHVFWTDDVSVADCPEVEMAALDGYRQLTDAHLIGLAVRRGGSLVTFDRAAADLAARKQRAVTLLGSLRQPPLPHY